MAKNKMSIKEFVNEGYLMEANRIFFHPLGLALTVIKDDEDGSVKFADFIQESTAKSGIFFPEKSFTEDKLKKLRKIVHIKRLMAKRRIMELGYVIQPIPGTSPIKIRKPTAKELEKTARIQRKNRWFDKLKTRFF